jgi:hypothetical protein
LFIGPVVLAVGYELYWQWVREMPDGAAVGDGAKAIQPEAPAPG